MVFNVGGGLGAAALGRWMDRGHRQRVMLACFSGMAVALLALLFSFRLESRGLVVTSAAAFAVGVFVIGTQLVLYGVAPGYYPTRVRATGVGAAVAAGRVGSIAGPLVAGSMLGAGANAAGVVTAMLPVVAIAGIAAVVLLRRPPLADT
jgi:AAHS family 3-hydroxyphenylpropionic acid transporter